MTSSHEPMATLRLFADHLSPADVDAILGLRAQVSATKGGGLYPRRDGSRVPAPTGTWFITSENHNLGSQPSKHLYWAVDLVAKHYDKLKRRIPDIKADLSLLVYDDQFSPSDLPRDLLKNAVQLGELEIEVPLSHKDWVLNANNLASYVP
jgi:hypothetical protein